MRLIFVLATLISGFLTISLFFFRATRKTYPGFTQWAAGVGFLTLGYLLMCLRGLIPEPLSILLGNVAFPLGMVLQLDGIRRFLGASPLSRLWYALPGIDLAAIAVLYYLHDSPEWRHMVTGVAISAPHWAIAALILRHPVKHKSAFFPVIGSTIALAGLVVLSRPIGTLLLPQWHLLMDSPFQIGSLAALIVLQLGENLSMIMLNSERLESELAEAETELRTTIDQLQEALADQKLAENGLRESEERYRDLVENIEDLICTHDLDGNLLFVNQAPATVLEYAAADLVGTNLRSYLAPEVRGQFDTYLTAIQRDGQASGLMIVQTRSGEKRIWEYRNTLRTDGPGGSIVRGLARDITDRMSSQEALKRSEANYRAMFDSMNDAVFVHDAESGVILDVNRTMCEMFRYTREEALRLNVESISTGQPRYTQSDAVHWIRKTVEEGPQIFEWMCKDKTQRCFWVEVSLKSASIGGADRIVAVVRDIADRKKAEEERASLMSQLSQAQKMEAIGTLSGGIAHDFNNLLTIINGYTEMILMDKTEDDPLYSDLQKVLLTGRQGAEMVQRLLTFSRKAEINTQPLDLNPVVESSVVLMKRTFPKMIEIETTLGKDLNMVRADVAQVEQVLMNLSINSKEAMREGGKLRIETKNVIVDEADCKLHLAAKPGPHVLIEVSDTGAGMDSETLDRLFDPFFTTKGWDFKKGTGLSLPVAKGIVEQHGGWITCESELGKGTTFRIYFPAMGESIVAEEITPRAIETLNGSARILLVDDEEYVRDLGRRILVRAGYEVITVSNGKEALDIYAREKSNIGLVILDLIMPHMSGEKCLEELLKINPRVKTVVSTGHSLGSEERDRIEARVKGLVNKPYQVKQLVDVVTRVMETEKMSDDMAGYEDPSTEK